MRARGNGFFKTLTAMLIWTLFAFFSGCDGTKEGEEPLWLGMIDSSNTLAPKGDRVQDSSDDSREGVISEDSETLILDNEAPTERVLSGSKDRREDDSDTSLNHSSEETGSDSASSRSITESENEAQSHEEPETNVSEGDTTETNSGGSNELESAEPTSGSGNYDEQKTDEPAETATVSFTVDLSCAGEVHEEHVYVLGMDQWNAEWSIATQLTRIDDSHHYAGTWEGAEGDYTFLVSHGAVTEGEINPWKEVEDIEGQDCVADSYGNRGVSATAGNNVTIVLTFGHCDGCPETCTGACGGTSSSGHCFCDSLCEEYDDCCDDYLELCASPSCDGNCGGHNAAGNCYCDENCSSYNDCCADYQDICEAEEI